MSRTHPIRTLSAGEHAAVFEHAKRLAVELRRQAINDFWAALARGIQQAWQGARGRGAASLTAAVASVVQRLRVLPR